MNWYPPQLNYIVILCSSQLPVKFQTLVDLMRNNQGGEEIKYTFLISVAEKNLLRGKKGFILEKKNEIR